MNRPWASIVAAWSRLLGSHSNPQHAAEIAAYKKAAGDATRAFYDVANALPSPVWTCDCHGITLFANTAFRTLAGDREPSWRVLVEPDDVNSLPVLDGSCTVRVPTRDGLMWFDLIHVAFEHGIVGIATDVTAVKTAEHDLSTMLEARNMFAMRISHEMRTPLTTILGYTELLSDGILPPDVLSSTCQSIHSAGQELLAITEQIALFAKLRNAEEPVKLDVIEVAVFIHSLLLTHRPAARERGLSLITDITYAPIAIHSDHGKLRRLLSELVVNAIKFTPRGIITLSVTEAAGSVNFIVKDSGPGIEHGDQRRIFDAFFRTHHAAVHEVRGAGLGLSVARSLAELLGGTLRVESSPGDGSSFILTLPR
jgi:signal transduction histidine kinase